jgi:glutaredoxin
LKELGLPEGLPSALPPLPAFTLPLPVPSAATAPTAGKKAPTVILYGADWCPHCTTAKEHMAKRAIAYVYRNVDEPEANKELGTKLSKAGQSKGGIPTTDIDGDLLVGWSEQQFDEMYDAKAKK